MKVYIHRSFTLCTTPTAGERQIWHELEVMSLAYQGHTCKPREKLSPRAVATQQSRDGEQDCTVEDWRESILLSRREDGRRAINYIA